MLVSKRYIWRPSHYWLSELAKYRTLDAGIRKSHWEVQISQNSVSDEEIVESLDHAASKVVQNFVFVPRCSRQWPGGRRTQPATASSLPLSLLAYRSRSSIPTCSIRSRPLASLLDTINLDNLAQVHTVLCLLEAHISILTPRSCTWTPLAMLLVEHWQSSSLPMLITGVRSSFTEHSHLVLQTVARSQWLTKRNRQETSDNHFLYCLLRSLIDPCILVKRSVGSCARFSVSRPDLNRPPAAIYARTERRRPRDLPDRQWSHCCNGALTPWAPVRQGNNTTEHYNPLLLYSVGSFLTLHRTLIVNLIYWFAQSVPTFLGSTTQPSLIPRVLYLAKPRPYLGLYPCGAVHNTLTTLNQYSTEGSIWLLTQDHPHPLDLLRDPY